jgi:hypothetical protein
MKATEKVILAPEIRGKYWSDPLMQKLGELPGWERVGSSSNPLGVEYRCCGIIKN